MNKIFVLITTLFFVFSLAGCDGDNDCATELNGGLFKSTSSDCVPDSQQDSNYLEPDTYVVGEEIEAGLYLFQATADTGTVQRLGNGGVVLGVISVRTHTYVELKSTDFAITFSGGTLINTNFVANFNLSNLIQEGNYLVTTELAPGDYIFKCDEEYTSATIDLLSAVDLEATSVIDSFSVDYGQDIDITVTIPNTVYAINFSNGYLVPVE